MASKEMIRVNTRISTVANQWIDKHSEETGLPKSTIIMLAIENYIREKETFNRMADMGDIVAQIEELKQEIKRG